MRYTTDGSDPKVAGGIYEEPFTVPENARVVLAIAERDGIESEPHRLEIADEPAVKPIEAAEPAVWTPNQAIEFGETRTTYGFIARLKKHGGAASGVALNVQVDNTWTDLHCSNDLALDGDQIEVTINTLRALVADGEVTISARQVRFETGQQFLDYIEETRTPYKRDG